MSEMEWHKGKAKKFPRLKNESDLDYAKRYAAHAGLEFDEREAVDYLEESFHCMFGEMQLGGSWRRQTALVAGNEIFELIEHDYRDEPPECRHFNLNAADGTYSFEYYFYNGGTCLSEMFEKSVSK